MFMTAHQSMRPMRRGTTLRDGTAPPPKCSGLPRLRSGIGTRPILPLKGSCTGLAEGHAPEVTVRRNEFESQVSFAFPAPRRDHFALHRLARVLVQQNHRLIRCELCVQRKQAPELTHRVRVRANDELLTIECLPIHAQGHRQCHTRRATPFDAPIIHNLHVHTIARHGSGWKALPRATPTCFPDVTTFSNF